jgi:hypothetical protein
MIRMGNSWPGPEELPRNPVARARVMRERARAIRAQAKAAARMAQRNRIIEQSRPAWLSKWADHRAGDER